MSIIRARVRAKNIAADGLTPIARWDVVPYQRIEQGATFKIGIVAFSKEGIEKVAFSTTDGTNTETDTVTSMTLNDRTGVWEYWTTLTCAAYTDSTNGVITLSATVTGTDGGTRVMDDITLIADTAGDLAQPEAWISLSGDTPAGNDSTGTVNDDAKPYLTIGRAALGVKAWNNANGVGDNTAGGIIRLNQGTHKWANGGYWSEIAGGDEWLTITTAAGGTATNTLVEENDESIKLTKCHVKGIGVYAHGLGVIYGGTTPLYDLWLDDCAMTSQYGRHNQHSLPVRQGWAHVWWDGCTMTNMYRSTGGDARFYVELIRDCTISLAGHSAIFDGYLVVNSTVDDVEGANSAHANGICWQDTNHVNRIIFGLKCTNLHYGGMNISRNPVGKTSENTAIVNMDVECTTYIDPGDSAGKFLLLCSASRHHFLMWHCTLRQTGEDRAWFVYVLQHAGDEGVGSVFTDSSFVANNFERSDMQTEASDLFFVDTEFDENHICTTPGGGVNDPVIKYDANVTVEEADMDASGVPTVGGNLVDRLSYVLVPIDLNGNERSATPDCGAYEYQV